MTLRQTASAWLSSQNAEAQKASANIEYMKYAMGSALAPVIQFITKLVYNLMKAIQGLVYAFSGVNIFAKATAKSMKSTAGSAKQTNKSLAGVHKEINNVSENNGSGGGGGTATPDMDLSKLDKKALAFAEKIKGIVRDIVDIFQKVWNSEPVQAFVSLIEAEFGFIKDLAIQLGTDLWNNMYTTWGNIEGNVSTTLSNISTLFTAVFTDIANGIDKWGKPIIDGVSKLFNSIWKDAIDPAIQIITKVWADFSGTLVELWDKHGKPLIDNIGEFVTNVIGLFQSIWDNVISPIIQPFLETLDWLWSKHIKGLIKEVSDFVMTLVNDALEIYNKFIDPIVKFLLEILSPAWSTVCSFIIGIFGTAIGGISDLIQGVIKVFRGLLDFITGVFTGNWKKAWEGIKSVFGGIFDGLKGLFKVPINWIIDGINAFISGINKIKIPDWVPAVGGKGFSIAKIPKLAKGNVAYSETLALFGEYSGARNNPEITTPQNIMAETFRDVLSDYEFSNSSQSLELTVNVGNEKLGRILLNDLRSMKRQTGQDLEVLVGG